jgi:hypothetical protein
MLAASTNLMVASLLSVDNGDDLSYIAVCGDLALVRGKLVAGSMPRTGRVKRRGIDDW